MRHAKRSGKEEFMIEFGIGFSTVRYIALKCVDSDDFEEA